MLPRTRIPPLTAYTTVNMCATVEERPFQGRVSRIEAAGALAPEGRAASSLDLLNVNFLSVRPMIRVPAHMSVTIADELRSSKIVLDEERVGA